MKGKLKQLRIDKEMTQKDLSEKIGVSQQQVSLYESGEVLPSMKVALKIADALDSTLDEIFLSIKTS